MDLSVCISLSVHVSWDIFSFSDHFPIFFYPYSVPDDEDVEFPVALQLRGQGRRVIMMETRTERQRRRTSETDEGTGERVEENGDGRESGGATTSLGGTLKSIIKTTTSTEGGRTRKEITFLEGVVNKWVITVISTWEPLT